jgi:hypothetical protein
MSEDQTPRLMLPVLQIGQADKERTHNEALALIDMVAAAAVEDVGRDVPPVDPQPGQCWIVGAAPSAEWVGHAHAIAGWTAGGWRFVAATPGLSAWCRALERMVTFRDHWEDGVVRARRIVVDGEQVIAARQPAIAAPAGGATIDSEARQAVDAIVAALRTHGLIA